MLETNKFVRKPFEIDAVRVTADNLKDVAHWCGGDVRTGEDQAKYVKVRVHRPLNDRQTQAFVGDWVLYAGTGFKVYTNKAFTSSFESAGVGSTFHTTDDEIIVETEEIKPVKVTKKVAASV